jgi:transcriptional regulator of acetoin/glycerol metabolism
MAGGGAFPDSFLCSDEAEALERHPGTEPLHLELHALRSQLESTVSPGGLIGVSLRMRTIHNLIGKARNHTFPVLILGETGTGKELVARCIHYSGSRKHAAFVAVDCSSLTPTLIESELFGHMRGAGRHCRFQLVGPAVRETPDRSRNAHAGIGHGRPECRSRHCDRRRSYVAVRGRPRDGELS